MRGGREKRRGIRRLDGRGEGGKGKGGGEGRIEKTTHTL